ncbi:chloride channel protein [Myroides sp. LJL119]
MLEKLPNQSYYQGIKKYTLNLAKWMLICFLIAVPIGLVCAFFLYSLEFVTQLRQQNPWLLYLLPLAGLVVGLLYYYKGGVANKGNNLLIQDYHNAQNTVPIKMGIFVLFGTLVTHLFGGSAGREGTALQIGASISEQFSKIFSLTPEQKKLLVLLGISGGFSAVFGTPLAGGLFAMEIMIVGKLQYKKAIPIFFTGFLANYVCHLTQVKHSAYQVTHFLDYNLSNTLWVGLAGVCFGLTGIVFILTTDFVSNSLNKYLKKKYMHPFLGAIVFIILVLFLKTDIYLGLGIPTIQESFYVGSSPDVFITKLVLTAIILGSGFKGGEVTPLFFIGATLGSALALLFDLPIDVLASIGFVGVFCACTKTPLACIAMAAELFGTSNSIYTALACVIAYLVSSQHTIYKSQKFNLENSTIK